MKFSIIIPVYNSEKYVATTLESVKVATRELHSKFADSLVECVCVDDGSTDGSPKILDGVASENDVAGLQFVVIHQKNSGSDGGGRNPGLAAATGDWLVFLDHDDVYLPNYLLRCAELISTHEFDACFLVSRQSFTGENYPSEEMGDGQVIEIADTERWKPAYLLDKPYISGVSWVQLLRASVYQSVKYPEHVPMLGDQEHVLDVLLTPGKVIWANWDNYGYRILPQSLSRSMPMGRALKVVQASSRIVDRLKDRFHCPTDDLHAIARKTAGIIERYLYAALQSEDVASAKELLSGVRQYEANVGCPCIRRLLKFRLWLISCAPLRPFSCLAGAYETVYRSMMSRIK